MLEPRSKILRIRGWLRLLAGFGEVAPVRRSEELLRVLGMKFEEEAMVSRERHAMKQYVQGLGARCD
jgi:hypothetical protein